MPKYNCKYSMDSRTITLYFPKEFEGGDLADGSVTTVKIADLAVTGEKVATSAIGSTHLIDALITTAKLANLSVSTEKLIDLTITAGKLASNSVETLKIVDDAITGIKIANAAIDTDKLSALSVTAAKLAGGVTDDIAQGITDAAAAQADATAAQADATSALSDLDDIAGDSKITPVEKLAVKLLWNAIASEKPDIDTQADTYSVSKVAYGTAYTTLDEYLNTTLTVFSNMAATTDIVRADWDTNFGVYYNAKVEILNAIASATALLADWSSITGAQKPADGADVTSYTDTRIANALSENDILTIARPIGATYAASTTVTGFIKIRLPQSWTGTMIRFIVDVYVLLEDTSFSLEVGGFTYTGGVGDWWHVTANLTGSTSANNRVRFAHDGSRCCILIGDVGDSWFRPKVSIRDFQAGHDNFELDKWDNDWTISVVNDLTGITVSEDRTDALIDAKSIIGQGILATEDTADFSTQVTGTEKPEDNADVTSYTDTRVANALEENSVLTISRPVGSSYSGGASDTGVIKIQLPQSWTDTMIRFTIDFYLFADYISFSLMIGGYNRSTNSTWISKTVSLFGSIAANNRVRFAHDGTYCCILIGETNTSWSYPKVSVRDFQAAGANKELDKWNDGWVISVVSDLTSYAISGDISDALIDASAIKDQGNLAVLDAVDSAQIVNLAVGNAAIANAAVTNAKIANLAVDTAQIVDAAIESAKIANLAVGAAAIASLAVGSAKIADAAILEAKIDDLAVTGAKIASLAVGTGHIASAAITEAKIGSLAVTSAKIASLAVTSAKINSLAVTEGKIESLAVTAAKIANATITGAKVANLAVDTLQIANQAVTIPTSAYTSGGMNVNAKALGTVQSVSITTTGIPLYITCSATISYDSLVVYYRLYRNSTLLFNAVGGSVGLHTFGIVDSPSSGTYTYYFKIYNDMDAENVTVANRTLMILGVKK